MSADKIKELKAEWADEVRKIEEKDIKGFNHKKANEEYDKLKNKYLPQMLELMKA